MDTYERINDKVIIGSMWTNQRATKTQRNLVVESRCERDSGPETKMLSRMVQGKKKDCRPEGEQKELEEIYKVAKRNSNRAVEAAKKAKSKEFANTEDEKQNIFKIAKQMVRKNKDTFGGKCLKDENGKTITGEENLKKRWKTYMEKLLNEENEWDEIIDADKVQGPQQVVSQEEVKKALKKMKSGKTGGPTGVVADMLKAGGETMVECYTDLCNSIIKEGSIPEDWKRSTITTLQR